MTDIARLWLVDTVKFSDGDEVGAFEWMYFNVERAHWPVAWHDDDLDELESEAGVVAYPDEQRELYMTDRARARQEFEDAEVRVFRAELDER